MNDRILSAHRAPIRGFPKNWELITDVGSVQNSLTVKRKNSVGMGWKQTDAPNTFRGDFRCQSEVRNSVYRLVMRATTFDFEISGSQNHCTITATDGGYVDRLPVLAKHSATGKSGIKKQNPLIAPPNLDVATN